MSVMRSPSMPGAIGLRSIVLGSVALAAMFISTGAATASAAPPVWDAKSRTEPTACDRLASGRFDRDRLARWVAREDIDVPAAIRQCEADLAAMPGDARLHFHLGRLYGYAGDAKAARSHREAAAAAGHSGAIFLLGYLDFVAAKDGDARCNAASRMKLAADRGNYAAQVAYTIYAVDGRVAGCPGGATRDELAAYVRAAKPHADGFFETLFADHLITELAAPAR